VEIVCPSRTAIGHIPEEPDIILSVRRIHIIGCGRSSPVDIKIGYGLAIAVVNPWKTLVASPMGSQPLLLSQSESSMRIGGVFAAGALEQI
jgi:hypothetical protein